MIRLAIIGAGSVRCGAPVLASLAGFYGERPLEVRLYDADEERLDLFDRLARVYFAAGQCTHEVLATNLAEEALEASDLVLVQTGGNCARKLLKREASVAEALPVLLEATPPGARVLSLLGDRIPLPLIGYDSIDWPEEPDLAARRARPHQILRWIREDDYVHDYLKQFEKSPVKDWLEASWAP